MGSRLVLKAHLTEQAETKLKSVLTSGFLKAESYSAPGYQHTQVTITPERERGRTLVSYNFLLLIFLVVIHWVFPGLGRSASILKNTESQTVTVDSAPTYFHSLPGIQLSCITAPGLEDWVTDQESGGSRETMRQPKLHLYFLHPVSLPACWQQLPSSFHCGERRLSYSRKVPGPGPLHMLLLHQVPGLQRIYKLFRVEL